MVKKVLGKGAMATVYLARENSLARDVALKVISLIPPIDYTAIRLFLRECQTVAALKHPNIITIYQLKQEQNSIHMVMELMPGGSLKERISQGLTLQQTLEFIRQIAEALEVVHQKGVIHRDIKPANILFMDAQTPVLTDFGIAKDPQHSDNLTKPGATLGTPNYISPEQAQGNKVDGRSDLYSLGVIFYEMLTGERPYLSQSAIEVAVMHIQAPIPTLPDCFAGAQPLLDRLLAKKPADRFSTVGAFRDALDQLDLSTDRRLLEALWQTGKSDAKNRVLAQTFRTLDLAQRSSGFDLLIQKSLQILQQQQAYEQVLAITNCLQSLLAWEASQAVQTKIRLDRWQIQTLSLWLEVQNRRYCFVAEEPLVQLGKTTVETLRNVTTHWKDWEICTRFYTLVAKNYLIAPYIEKSVKKANHLLKAYVDYFRKYCQKTPLGPLRSCWIGALYSTFGQTLAYSAHAAFFRDQDPSRTEHLTNGALKYSAKALEHFSHKEDQIQQYTDQAHAHLQHYMLSKRPQSYRTATKLLRSSPTPEETVATFLSELPGWQTITTAYRVAVLLKSIWLMNEYPHWLALLKKGVIANVNNLKAIHPYQKILGYLALLEEDLVAQECLCNKLAVLKWRGHCALSAQIFLAQIEHSRHQVLTKETIIKLSSLPKETVPLIPPHYIQRELSRYKTVGQGHLPGPLVMLPFDFC